MDGTAEINSTHTDMLLFERERSENNAIFLHLPAISVLFGDLNLERSTAFLLHPSKILRGPVTT